MGFKLFLLAAMGLGALYLIHILAMDYQRIRKPAAKLARFLISKRDLNAVIHPGPDLEPEIDNFVIEWDRIIKNDPLDCALLLICQVSAGAEKHNKEAVIINTLIRYGIANDAPAKIKKAYELGIQLEMKSEQCYKKYSKCPWSTKSMLRILQLYSFFFAS